MTTLSASPGRNCPRAYDYFLGLSVLILPGRLCCSYIEGRSGIRSVTLSYRTCRPASIGLAVIDGFTYAKSIFGQLTSLVSFVGVNSFSCFADSTGRLKNVGVSILRILSDVFVGGRSFSFSSLFIFCTASASFFFIYIIFPYSRSSSATRSSS